MSATRPQKIKQYLSAKGSSRARPVVCLGDSITAGQASFDWVRAVSTKLADRELTFVNAGENGNLAWNALQRLDDVIACEPATVTLLIGTNDVGAADSDALVKRFRRYQRLPQDPTRDWYLENVDAILTRLRSETDARIAVLDIPPLGENLDGRTNQRVDSYNLGLLDIVSRHDVTVLPIHDAIAALIPPGDTSTWSGDVLPILVSEFQHSVLRRSWDDISKRNGLAALTDHIHLSDRAGAIVVQAVADYLRRETP